MRLKPELLSNRALTLMGQIPQLIDLGIAIPEAIGISFPLGSFRRVAKLCVICGSIGSLKGLWLSPMGSNLTQVEVDLIADPLNGREIRHIFSTVKETSPHLRELSICFTCMTLPFLSSLF